MGQDGPIEINIWLDIGLGKSKESEWVTDEESSALWDRMKANVEAIWTKDGWADSGIRTASGSTRTRCRPEPRLLRSGFCCIRRSTVQSRRLDVQSAIGVGVSNPM